MCCRPNDVVGSHTLKIEAAGSAETSVTSHPQDSTLPRHRNQNHKHGLIKKLHCINYKPKHLERPPVVCKIYKKPVRTAQRTINRLMVFRGIIAAYSANHLKYTDYVDERQNNFNVKPAAT